MFHKALSMLLCVCMLTSNVPTTAYAMESTEVEQSESMEEVSAFEEDETDFVTNTEAEATFEEETNETVSEETVAEKTASEETEEEAITEEPVSEEIEEEAVTEEPISEEIEKEAVTKETAKENGEEKAEKVVYEAAEEMLEAQTTEEYILRLGTPLEVNDIGNTPVNVLFTAESAGIYEFVVENKGEWDSLEIGIGYEDQEEMEFQKYFSVPNSSGETVYVNASEGAVIGLSAYFDSSYSTLDMEIRVSKLDVTERNLTKGESGEYKGTANEFAMSVNVEEYCQTALIDVKLDSATEEALNNSQYYVFASVIPNKENDIVVGNYMYFLYSSDDYKGLWQQDGLDMGETYSMQFIVKDDHNDVVAVFTGAEFTTKTIEEKVSLGVGEVTHSTAEVWWEEIVAEENFLFARIIAYAPVNEPEKQVNFEIDTIKNFGDYYIQDLKPNTQYRLWLMDSNFLVLKETTFTTKPLTLEVDYDVNTLDSDTIRITVNITEYDGDADSLELYVNGYEKIKGEKERHHSIELEKTVTGKKTGTLGFDISNLEGGKTYSLNFYLKDTVFSQKYGEVTKTVTMPEGVIKADNITIEPVQNEETPTTLDVRVSLDKVLEKDFNGILYYYLPKTEMYYNTSDYVSITIPSGETTGMVSIPELVEGAEYELLLAAVSDEYEYDYSFAKKTTYLLGESIYTPIVTDNTDALFSDLTYQLDSLSALKEAEWKVEAKIYADGYWRDLGYEPQYLTSENEFTVTYHTASVLWLNTNTDYTVRWTLYKDGQVCHLYDYDFKTGQVDVSTEVEAGIDVINYDFKYNSALSEEKSTPLYVKVTEKGTNNFFDTDLYLGGSADREQTLTFTGLKADTAYDITIYGGRDGELFKTETITTMEDDKVLKVGKTVGMIAALLDVEVTGTSIEGQIDNVKIFYRKKGSEKWNAEFVVVNGGNTAEGSIYLNGLEGNSTYEYEVGIVTDYFSRRETLRAKETGEFTTNPDIRILTIDTIYTDSNTLRIALDIENEETVNIDEIFTPSGYQIHYREIGSRIWNKLVWKGSPYVFLDGLKEDTTYEYEVGLNNGKETDRTELKNVISGTFTTGINNYNPTLTVQKTIGSIAALFKMKVIGTGTENDDFEVILYYRKKGSDDWKKRNCYKENGEYRAYVNGLNGDTVYEYEVGIGENYNTPKENLTAKISGKFTTNLDNRILRLNDIDVGINSVNISMNIENEEIVTEYAGEEVSGIQIYYRETGSEDWNKETRSGTYISFDGLKEETTYEYEIGLNNGQEVARSELKSVISGTFTTLPDNRQFIVDKIIPYATNMEARINTIGMEKDSIYVLLYYKEQGTEKWLWDYQYIYGDGNHTLYLGEFAENKTYDYVIGIGRNYDIAKEELKQTVEGTFTTITDDRSIIIENLYPSARMIQFEIKLTGKAAGGGGDIQIYYRKTGSEDNWSSNNFYYINDESSRFDLLDLTENTEYEYVIGIGDWDTPKEELKAVLTGTMKTLKDDRTLSVVMTPTYQGVKRTITVTGEAAKYCDNYIVYGWKEKGAEVENVYYDYFYGMGNFNSSYWNEETFKEGTTYEYWAGIGDSSDTPKEELKSLVEGEFTTLKDETTLGSVTCTPGYTSVKFTSFIEKNKAYNDLYVHYFYKKAGQVQWNYRSMEAGSEEILQNSYTITELEPEIAYEYVIAVSSQYSISSPEEITKEYCKKSGTFTTKKNEYAIIMTQDNSKTTASKAVLNLKAEQKGTDDKIYVTLRLATGHSVETVLSRQNNYQGTATFTNLTAGSEYAVSEAVISTYENGNKMEIHRYVPGTTVTTKEGKTATKISLSKKELALNLADSSNYIGSYSLKATLTPQDAQTGILWESSNPQVASVNGRGYVQAAGEGTATITARAAQNPEVTAACEVTVKNYVVGQTQETGVQAVTENFYLNQGDSLEGLGLYAVSGNTLTLVEDFSVSVEKNNLAQWKDGVLTAGNPGTTRLYFEKDGVKAQTQVQVSYKEYHFGLTGLNVSDSRYPANLLEENVYEVAVKENLHYMVQGEMAPYRYFDTTEYNWTSSDETVALVSEGILTPVKAGTAVITATPKGNGIVGESKITLQVKELPTMEEQPAVYVLTSQLSKKSQLKEIPLPKELGEGWKWCEPETALYNLPVYEEAYEFEAYYAKDDKYPREESVRVYLGTIKNVTIEKENGSHTDVLEVSAANDGQKDKLTLRVAADTVGRISPQIQWKLAETVEGLSITVQNGVYTISALEPGEYDLAPFAQYVETDATGKVVKEETIFTGSYKVTAVEAPQAAQILLTTDTEGFEIDKETGMLSFEFTSEMKGKKIDLKAVVKDRKGKELEVPLTWKVTDKSVAAIAANKNDSHTAVLTVKGEGNAVLTVQAKDTAAFMQELDLEFRNYAPRVNTSKAKVNIALDYTDWYGEYTASQTLGGVEIVEAYNNYIKKISFVKQDGTLETNLVIEDCNYEGGYVVKPATPDIPTGTYKCTMVIETEKGDYEYPMTVTVENKQPSVKAKMTSKVNLFYKTNPGRISITLPETYRVDEVVWKDNSEVAGFEVGDLDGAYISKKQHLYYLNVKHENVEVENRKLVDTNVAKGTLYVKVEGFRDLVEIKNFSIGYQYKAPKLKAVNASGNIVPKVGITNTSFRVYDTQMKRNLYYSQYSDSYYYYNYITDDNENVNCSGSGSYIYVSSNGKQKKETVNLILDSKNWREPLQVKYTVKTIEPKAYLSNATLTYNKADRSMANAYVYLKNVNYVPGLMDIEYIPSNAKAKALTEKNVFTIGQDGNNSYRVAVGLNSAEILEMGEELKPGTYSYKLTPYYKNTETGEKTALNTLTLKLKVIDKPATVKVTAKGTLDLIDSYNWEGYGDSSRLRLSYKFKDLPAGYNLDSVRLKGEYSEYFTIGYNYYNYNDGYCYLQISEEGVNKLKAGHTYPITLEYTMRNDMGDTLTVESNVLKIKPKQSTPKVMIADNNQVLYASNSNLSRSYQVSFSNRYYEIQDITGSLDVNKDGRADLSVEVRNNNGWYAYVNVRILDADAITATAKGKSYSIPLTITFEGRDGISKDVTTNLKVTVKR